MSKIPLPTLHPTTPIPLAWYREVYRWSWTHYQLDYQHAEFYLRRMIEYRHGVGTRDAYERTRDAIPQHIQDDVDAQIRARVEISHQKRSYHE